MTCGNKLFHTGFFVLENTVWDKKKYRVGCFHFN
jgi:hypothetical protein